MAEGDNGWVGGGGEERGGEVFEVGLGGSFGFLRFDWFKRGGRGEGGSSGTGGLGGSGGGLMGRAGLLEVLGKILEKGKVMD